MSNIFNNPLVVHARRLAEDAHTGQKRKYDGEDYIVHPQRVAQMVADHGGTPTMVAVALLHDTIEDTWVTYEYLVEEFTPELADMVWELSDQYTHEAFPDNNRAERKAMEAQRLGQISVDAQTIKYCDLIDNTRDIVKQDIGFAKTYLKEKRRILALMDAGNIVLYEKAIQHLRDGEIVVADAPWNEARKKLI